MSYQFTPEDREIQDRARQFVDEELIPWEVHAEMHAGEIPAEVKQRQKQFAHDLGLTAINPRLRSSTRWSDGCCRRLLAS